MINRRLLFVILFAVPLTSSLAHKYNLSFKALMGIDDLYVLIALTVAAGLLVLLAWKKKRSG